MAKLDAGKLEIGKTIESLQEKYWRISDAIWTYAELPLEEYKSAKLLANTLENAGFEIEMGVGGMPTAFVASRSNGSGKPVIGFLAEYDALPMLSQKGGASKHDPVVSGAPGHGCGHNTMGTMQALAIIALKEYAQKEGIDCTLKFFGSPAEEMLVSRPYMIRDGAFKGVDAVIDCHTGGDFSVSSGVSGSGMFSFTVTFTGKTAHSGGNPWMGRSATDAVELMHAGTERMREHTPVTERTHWVTTEGGEAPNVVPDTATTWYFIRDIDENLEDRFKWVMDCAKGAALMTQTTYEMRFLTGCHQRHGNKALAELIFENIEAVGLPEYTPEEDALAKAIQKSEGKPEIGLKYEVKRTEDPPYRGGSSDVGDVTLITPCATIRYPFRPPGDLPSHHWTVTTIGNTGIAHKGLTAGAKAAAFSAFDLLTKPDRLKKIREDFENYSKDHPYKSFLPGDAEPPLGWNTELMSKYREEMEKYYVKP